MKRASIEAMYRQYGPMVLRRTRRLLGDEAAAQDAMQEVFVKALTVGSSFRAEASPTTWLYRIATNYCLNEIRDNTRRRELLEENAPSGQEAHVNEARLVLRQLLDRFPEDLRELAVYYYLDNLTHKQIADMLGVSRRTVGNRLDEFRRFAMELENAS